MVHYKASSYPCERYLNWIFLLGQSDNGQGNDSDTLNVPDSTNHMTCGMKSLSKSNLLSSRISSKSNNMEAAMFTNISGTLASCHHAILQKATLLK